MTKALPHYGYSAPPPPTSNYNQSDTGHNDKASASNNQHQCQQNNQYGQNEPGYPRNQNVEQWTQDQAQQQQQYSHPPAHGPEVEQFKSHFDLPSAQHGHNNDYYNAPQQQYNQPQTEDRGALGATGGAAAGGLAGDKLDHRGIIETTGGAVADDLLDDQHKKHKKHKKDYKHKRDKKRDHSPDHLGNFSLSASSIRLEQDQYLVADCKDVNGYSHQSRIDLNDCLSNINGEFRWGRQGNFTASAKDVKLKSDGSKLKAKLRTADGDWVDDSIKLNERISNDNGRLFFID